MKATNWTKSFAMTTRNSCQLVVSSASTNNGVDLTVIDCHKGEQIGLRISRTEAAKMIVDLRKSLDNDLSVGD